MFFFSTRSLDTVGCCGCQININREWLFSCRRRCVYDWEWTGKDKRTWSSVGRKWPSCLVIGGAHEKIALSSLLTAQTERKLSQSVEGQTATHPPHFLSLYPPSRLKSLFYRRAEKQSAPRRTRLQVAYENPQLSSSYNKVSPSHSGTHLKIFFNSCSC